MRQVYEWCYRDSQKKYIFLLRKTNATMSKRKMPGTYLATQTVQELVVTHNTIMTNSLKITCFMVVQYKSVYNMANNPEVTLKTLLAVMEKIKEPPPFGKPNVNVA